jgi:hypothetical protein
MTCLMMALSLITVGSTGLILTPIHNSCCLYHTPYSMNGQAAAAASPRRSAPPPTIPGDESRERRSRPGRTEPGEVAPENQ